MAFDTTIEVRQQLSVDMGEIANTGLWAVMLCVSAVTLVWSWTFGCAAHVPHTQARRSYLSLCRQRAGRSSSSSSSSETAVRRATTQLSRTLLSPLLHPNSPSKPLPRPGTKGPFAAINSPPVKVCASRFSLIGEPLFHTVYIRGAKDLAQASYIEGRLLSVTRKRPNNSLQSSNAGDQPFSHQHPTILSTPYPRLPIKFFDA